MTQRNGPKEEEERNREKITGAKQAVLLDRNRDPSVSVWEQEADVGGSYRVNNTTLKSDGIQKSPDDSIFLIIHIN